MKIHLIEGMRKSLPQITQLIPKKLQDFLGNGSVSGHFTEKTDGSALGVGYDKNGFYTQSSSSGKMYTPDGYKEKSIQKFGNNYNKTLTDHQARIHKLFAGNKKLVNYLKNSAVKSLDGDSMMKGEIFYKPFGKHDGNGNIKFVATPYRENELGNTGAFILHHKLPENKNHNPDTISQFNDDHFKFDHDKIGDGKKATFDFSDELAKLHSIPTHVLSSKKLRDQHISHITGSVHDKMMDHLSNFKSKWGNSYPEGFVFHPDSPNSPRIKVLTSDFIENKKKFKLNESSGPKDVSIAMSVGRFNGPTVEHGKLLDKLFSQPTDHHYVFVMGPKHRSQITEKDPLTREEKARILRKLYPEHANSFVTNVPSLFHAINHVYDKHKEEAPNIHLHTVAGTGLSGVKNQSSMGGGINKFREIFKGYNGKKSNFNFKSLTEIPNERGTVSGSLLRKTIRDSDLKNPQHQKTIGKMLHPRISTEDRNFVVKRIRDINTKRTIHEILERILMEPRLDSKIVKKQSRKRKGDNSHDNPLVDVESKLKKPDNVQEAITGGNSNRVVSVNHHTLGSTLSTLRGVPNYRAARHANRLLKWAQKHTADMKKELNVESYDLLREMAFPSNYQITNKTSNKSLGKLATRKDDLGRRARAELKRRLKLKAEVDARKEKTRLEREKKKVVQKSKKLGTPVKVIEVSKKHKKQANQAIEMLGDVLTGKQNFDPGELASIVNSLGATDPKKVAMAIKKAAEEAAAKKTQEKINRMLKKVEREATRKAMSKMKPKLDRLRELEASQSVVDDKNYDENQRNEEIRRQVNIAGKMTEWKKLRDAELISSAQLEDIRNQLNAGVEKPVPRSEQEMKTVPFSKPKLTPLRTVDTVDTTPSEIPLDPGAEKAYTTQAVKINTRRENGGILNRIKGILRGKLFSEATGDGGLVKKTKDIANATKAVPPINQKTPTSSLKSKLILPQANTSKKRTTGMQQPKNGI